MRDESTLETRSNASDAQRERFCGFEALPPGLGGLAAWFRFDGLAGASLGIDSGGMIRESVCSGAMVRGLP